MSKENGKPEAEAVDLEHELPSADPKDGFVEKEGKRTEQPPALSETDKLRAERDTLLDRLARSQAEFENARKRAAREQAEFRDYALTDAAKTLLPVLDSFERALQTEGGSSEFRSGVELIHRQLQDALTKMGVQAIPAKGEPFDPRFHEAIEMVESTEVKDNHVLEELQRGYKLKDRLLRPAMVRVARNNR